MKTRTSQLAAFKHPEFVLEHDDAIPTGDVRLLEDYLLHVVASGRRFRPFRPRQTLQVGWMLTQVEQAGDGALTLSEVDLAQAPRLPSDLTIDGPLDFVPGVTQTLTHLRLQRETAASVGLEARLAFPRVDETARVCGRFMSATRCVELYRQESAYARDSGWFIGCDDGAHDHTNEYELGDVPLTYVARARPEVIPFLALPEGAGVLLGGRARLKVLMGEDALPIRKGSLLDARGLSARKPRTRRPRPESTG